MVGAVSSHSSTSVTQLADDIRDAVSNLTGNSKVVIDKVTQGDDDNPATVTWHTENVIKRAFLNLVTWGKYGAAADAKVALAFKTLVEKGASNGNDVEEKKAAFELAQIFEIPTYRRGNIAKKFTDAVFLNSLKSTNNPVPQEAAVNPTTQATTALQNITGASNILKGIPGEYDAVNQLVDDHANTISQLKAFTEGATDVDVEELHGKLLDFQERLENIPTRSGGIIVNLRTGVVDALNAVGQQLGQPAYESNIVNAHKERVARFQRDEARAAALARQAPTRPSPERVSEPSGFRVRPAVTPVEVPVSRPETTYTTPTEKLSQALRLIETAHGLVSHTTGDGPAFKAAFDNNIPSKAVTDAAKTVLDELSGAAKQPSNVRGKIQQLATAPETQAALNKYPSLAGTIERYYQLAEDIDKGLNANPPATREALKTLRESAQSLQIELANSHLEANGEPNGDAFNEIFSALAPFVTAIAEAVPNRDGSALATQAATALSPEAKEKLQQLETALERTHNALEDTPTRTGGSHGFTRSHVFQALNHVRAINGKEPVSAQTNRFV